MVVHRTGRRRYVSPYAVPPTRPQPARRERPAPAFYSLSEAADVLGISRATASRMRQATGTVAGIPVIQLSPRRFGVSRSAVDELAARR